MIVVERVLSGKFLYVLASITNPTTEAMEDATTIVVNIGQISATGTYTVFDNSPFTMAKVEGATGVYGVAIPVADYISGLDRCLLYVQATVGGVVRGAIDRAVDFKYVGVPSTGPGNPITVDMP